MLLGVWLHRKFFAIRTAGPASHSEGSNRSPASQPSPLPLSRALAVGATTLLTWMPVVILTSQAGVELTRRAGLPVESQEVLTFFRDNRSPVMLAAMLFSAVVIAPINEELIFRATLFRYTRTRLPRWAGLALPAFLFSALHGSIPNYIPLAVLGIAFSLAYERTGRIESAIFAHALFNGYNVACLFIAPELVR